MQNPRHLNLLINVVGGLSALAVVGYIVYAQFHTETEQPCSARYAAATRFSLTTGAGKPLTAIELQARAGARDLGVIDNASVVAADGAPSPEVLEVKLRKLPGAADASDTARNGIEFRWAPPGIGGKSAACLSYSVWLPDKFAFASGGVLPGVFAATPSAPRQQGAGQVWVTPQWSEVGEPLLAAALEGGDIRRVSNIAQALPTGRWFKVEQEVVLNEPGTDNGIIRLWIDGGLVAEDQHAPLRKDASVTLAGVLVQVGYRHALPEPGMLRLSPLEISAK